MGVKALARIAFLHVFQLPFSGLMYEAQPVPQSGEFIEGFENRAIDGLGALTSPKIRIVYGGCEVSGGWF